MSSRQDWKPDFGFYLAGQDIGDKAFMLPEFPLETLALLGPGEFSTTANPTIDGQEYAATFDFEQSVFDGMLETMPDYMADGLRSMVGEINDFPAMVRFPDPVMLTIEARLGEIAHGDGEDFMPLVAHSITYQG